METYAKILMIASPIFFVFVMSEKLYVWYFKKHEFKQMDMISSLSSGFTNALKDSLGLGISLITYMWLEQKVALVSIPFTWLNVVIAFIALDFAGYWGHRLNHYNNFFWNQHIIHHSSEEFNLACALRQSISNFVNFFTIFLLPAALLGVDFKIIAIIAPIHLFAQFWYHTIYIGKMGILEKIIVTPSHHRVHHAINPIYIDKNHGQIFIIWDKLFGSFQEELDTEPPVFGITVPVRTWNPIKINFQHIWLLFKDSFRTKKWSDKLKVWYGKTGWRPDDMNNNHPVVKINDPYKYEKYAPKASKSLIIWSWIQFFTTFSFLMHLYSRIGHSPNSSLIIYGVFIMLSIYSFTELMDKNKNAIWMEVLKNGFGVFIFLKFGSWFNLSSSYTSLIFIYFAVSIIVVSHFCFKEFKKELSISDSLVGKI
jgi:sterol desaturase/sphingolipid hydroxylase (fatty acid hydroxylase superfamily)